MDWTDEQVEAWKQVFELAGVDLDALEECLVKITKAAIITCMEFEKAMVQVVNVARASLIAAASVMEEFEALESELKKLNLPTVWDRKKQREKWCAVERATASRFRQYKTRELSWKQRQGKRPRWREWRGPCREG